MPPPRLRSNSIVPCRGHSDEAAAPGLYHLSLVVSRGEGRSLSFAAFSMVHLLSGYIMGFEHRHCQYLVVKVYGLSPLVQPLRSLNQGGMVVQKHEAGLGRMDGRIGTLVGCCCGKPHAIIRTGGVKTPWTH